MREVSGTRASLAALLGLALAACGNSEPIDAAGDSRVAPELLSRDVHRVAIGSTEGSGHFGTWTTDRYGLPAYNYTIDQNSNPIAVQKMLDGSHDGWNQVANRRVKVDAHTDGRMQFWNQDRRVQWANEYEPDSKHYSGGWGYLRFGGQTISTAYDDNPSGPAQPRRFGVGYFERRTEADPVAIAEIIYAPFGDDPLILHDVTLSNHSAAPVRAVWWEYWDINPVALAATGVALARRDHIRRGLSAMRANDDGQTLVVDQTRDLGDADPLSIFAAGIGTRVEGYETTTSAFFGQGGRAAPDAVAADRPGNTLAGPALPVLGGSSLAALRTPVTIPAGGSITLRYAYGMAHREAITPLLDKYRAAADPLAASMEHWRAAVPQVEFGDDSYRWLSRELQWDAYMLKGGERYAELCGTHVFTQGGYYQYAYGYDGVRDPLEHQLGILFLDPAAARESLIWALQFQRSNGEIPYLTAQLCKRNDTLLTSNELAFWTMLAIEQYVVNTRDFAFLDEQVRYYDGGSATVWEHLQRAFEYQETGIGYGPHGLYRGGLQGDTFDLTTVFLQVLESTSTTGNFAYIYPVMARLADWKGDAAFALKLRAAADGLHAALRREWQPRGWFARAWTATRGHIGVDTIYADAQYWPLAAGVATPGQQQLLLANIRRYLDGEGRPADLGGPSKIGPMQLPGKNDPDISESSTLFPGRDLWYFINGPAVWTFAALDGRLPGAAEYAWSIFRRFTLTNHATEFPDYWSGVISTDDTCAAPTSGDPGQCGIGTVSAQVVGDGDENSTIQGGYSTQITHVHAWSLFTFFKLAGIEGTPDGYTITPHLPMQTFSVRTPVIGVAYEPRLARGYVRPLDRRPLNFIVKLPSGSDPIVRVNGLKVAATITAGSARFTAAATDEGVLDWSVQTR